MLSIPFNGDLSLIDYASRFGVGEIYGQVTCDSFGGGRSLLGCTEIDETVLRQAIEKAHQHNIKFTYIMNSFSFANMEFDRYVQSRLLTFVDKLLAFGLESLTIANPFLIHLIKTNFPQLMITASVITNTECLEQIELLSSLGATRIVLSKSLTKDLLAIEQLAKATNVELQLIVNDPCLRYCPFKTYHNVVNGFSSMRLLKTHRHLSFCTMMCRKAFLEKPYKLVMATYIRPEDLHRYRQIGITSFKLVDRNESTPWLQRAIRAYSDEEYDGNLADLCSYFSPIKGKGEIDHNNELRQLSFDDITDIDSINNQKNNLRFKPFINNKKYGTHMESLLNRCCQNSACVTCGICEKVFADVGYIDETQRRIVLSNINLVLSVITQRNLLAMDLPEGDSLLV